MKTKEELAKEWVGRRVEFSGEDEAPNISSLIDKVIQVEIREVRKGKENK